MASLQIVEKALKVNKKSSDVLRRRLDLQEQLFSQMLGELRELIDLLRALCMHLDTARKKDETVQ